MKRKVTWGSSKGGSRTRQGTMKNPYKVGDVLSTVREGNVEVVEILEHDQSMVVKAAQGWGRLGANGHCLVTGNKVITGYAPRN